MTSVEMRQQRADIITQMQALHDAAEAEGRDLTPEEATQWDGLKASADGLKARILRAEELEAEAAAAAASMGVVAGKPQPDAPKEDERKVSMNELIRAAAGIVKEE